MMIGGGLVAVSAGLADVAQTPLPVSAISYLVAWALQ